MGIQKRKKKPNKKKRARRRKIRRVFSSAVAMLLATATVVFCLHYIVNETEFFDINGLEVFGNTVYTDDFLIDKLGINLGESLFKVDRHEIANKLKSEVYVKDCKVSYSIPNKIRISVDERIEKYLILYNDETIIVDNEGIVLDGFNQYNNLFTIECFTDVIYNIGEVIKIQGIDDFSKIDKFVDYVNSTSLGDELQKISIGKDGLIVILTKYGTSIKLKLTDDINYNYNFGLEIIKSRIKNNEEVQNGLIDFTKGESPVYSNIPRMEDN